MAEHNLATDVWGFIDPTGHAHLCLTEGCSYREQTTPHRSSGPATEDADEVCLDCGYVITKALNHTHTPLAGYQTDGESHWTVCGCGEILEKLAHADDDGDGKCDVCQKMVAGQPIPPETDAPPLTEPSTEGEGEGEHNQNGGSQENEDGKDDPSAPNAPVTDPADGDDDGGMLWITVVTLLLLCAGAATVVFLKKKK